MTGHRLTKLSVAIGLSIATSSTLASPQSFMSARSFAMGGTGVAVAVPADAPAENPAMMAADHHSWNDDFGLTLPSVNARVADEEETVDQVDEIQDVIKFLESDLKAFDVNSSSIEDIQKNAGDLQDRLAALNKDTVRGNTGAGLAIAFPSQSLSIAFFGSGTGTVTARGDVATEDEDFLVNIATVNSASELDSFISSSDKVERDSNGDVIGIALESKGTILASAMLEAGVSLARNFSLDNGGNLQLGVSPKFVRLYTFQYTEIVSDFDEDAFDNDRYRTEKSGFNIDIGAAYSWGEGQQWNAGITAKNLIPMELDSAQSRGSIVEQKHTFQLDPMVTAGIAHKSEYHVVTAEIDLTKKEAFGFEDDTQWAALGAEFDAFRYAQLRVGVRHNLASNDDNDGIEEKTQFTAGLGLNIVGVRLDLGALYSDADVGAALELGTAF